MIMDLLETFDRNSNEMVCSSSFGGLVMYSGADWKWDNSQQDRFNPMDAGTHARIDIAILQAIDSLRLFVSGKTGVFQMDNEEFAALLEVAAASARRVS